MKLFSANLFSYILSHLTFSGLTTLYGLFIHLGLTTLSVYFYTFIWDSLPYRYIFHFVNWDSLPYRYIFVLLFGTHYPTDIFLFCCLGLTTLIGIFSFCYLGLTTLPIYFHFVVWDSLPYRYIFISLSGTHYPTDIFSFCYLSTHPTHHLYHLTHSIVSNPFIQH